MVKKKELLKEMGYKEEIKKIEIERPKSGRLISKFALDVSEILKDKNILFYRPDSKDVVEVGKLKVHSTGKEVYTGFISIKPNRFITLLEKYIIPIDYVYNKEINDMVPKEKSIGSELSNTIISSQILQQALPQITRIFTIPLPIIYKGKLTFPKKGYDKRFGSWLPHDAPEISDPDMKLKDAKKILFEIFKEFCFKNKQDYTNAIAGLLTPFLKGLFKKFNTRTPIFFYLGNREGIGKDYLAGIIGIVYEGNPLEESPISGGERNKYGNNDELRKKILSALMYGRKRLHFSNNKGHINNAVLESVSTAEQFSDRMLGRNELLTFDNELDLSLSGNMGVTFTPDFARRCRFIRLFYSLEDVNARKFKNPILQDWVKKNRNSILSALFSLVRNWIDKGGKNSEIPFTSYYEWGKICGGIMESAGCGNPCVPDKETLNIGGNIDNEIKRLFELCYEKHPEEFIKKSQIREVVSDDSELFSYLDFTKKSDQIKFARKLSGFVDRIFSDIKLILQDNTVRPARQEFKFTKEIIGEKQEIFGKDLSLKNKSLYNVGNKGNKGNKNTTTQTNKKQKGIIIGQTLPTLPLLPKFKSLETFDFQILKKGEIKNLSLESGKKYKIDVLGDNAKNILNILLVDKKIEILEDSNESKKNNGDNKEYKDYGSVDFGDHQTEQAEEQCEKDRKEIEGGNKNE